MPLPAPRSAAACLVLALVAAGSAVPPVRATVGATEVRSAPQERGDVVRLLRLPGVSGYEEPVRQAILEALPDWADAEVDGTGNVVVTLGSGSPHTLVIAPLDEPGFVVSDITQDGYLRLYRATSSDNPLYDQHHYGQPMLVLTSSGAAVPAVSATVSTHIRGDGPREDANRVRTIDDLWVDLGADSGAEVQRLGVRHLDPVVLRDRAVTLAGGRMAGPGAQGRAAAAAVLALVGGRSAPPQVAGTVTLAWTAQTAFGGQGLEHLARRIHPDRAFVFVTAALRAGRGSGARGGGRGPTGAGTPMSPLSDEQLGAVGQLGRGVLVDEADAALTATTTVAVQPVSSASLGRRVRGEALGWADAELHTVAIPVRYAQTPVEMIDGADVVAATGLIAEAIGPDANSGSRLTDAAAAGGGAGPEPASRLVDAIAGDAAPVTGSFRTLARLIEAYGVSGHEAEVREILLAGMPDWAEPEIDAQGNITVTIGQGEPHVMFVAHQDEVGYEVASIENDGRLGLRRRGGFLETLYEAHPTLVHTSAGAVAGVVAPRPGYVTATTLNPSGPGAALRVDIGTRSRAETEAAGVRAGDQVTVVKRFQPLAGDRATGRAVDDRVGSTALLLVLQRLDPAAIDGRRVTFTWSIEEETGLTGAATIAERARPDTVFAVDTFVSSASPVDWQRRARVPLGAGPVVKVIDGNHVTPRAAVDRILAIAGGHGIPVNLSITGGGTDAGAFIPYGAVPIPIGWPSRYSHSPVELMDRGDLDALIDLILALTYEY
jgi:putative aminopeptidase FrvX